MSDKSESRLLPFGHNCIFLSPVDGNQSIDREPLARAKNNTGRAGISKMRLIKDNETQDMRSSHSAGISG